MIWIMIVFFSTISDLLIMFVNLHDDAFIDTVRFLFIDCFFNYGKVIKIVFCFLSRFLRMI